MKTVGITRQLDQFGRIVIPKEIRKHLNINVHDPVEIYVDKDKIILEKYDPTCCFCQGTEDLLLFKDKIICKSCSEDVKQQFKTEEPEKVLT
ncbi:MAG: AbrB/MazE/SpoVT family DNA-binding domain-containing protein [Bacillaceae bacterium]|nr:AbrB/MazE/SpoVT family DNA-binding domain-containing protein [Bacillaceae bacterium]